MTTPAVLPPRLGACGAHKCRHHCTKFVKAETGHYFILCECSHSQGVHERIAA